MVFQTLRQAFSFNERMAIRLSYVLVSAMMVSVMALFIEFGRRLDPTWDAGYLLVAGFLVSLEAFYSQNSLRKVNTFSVRWAVQRASEWVVILLLLKIVLYLLRGSGQFLIDLPLWRRDFMVYFFRGEYLVAVVLVWIIWSLSGWFAEALDGLQGDEEFLDAETRRMLRSDRGQARKALAERVFILGGIMIVLTGVLRLDMQALNLGPPIQRTGVANLMVFFLLGLALLGLSQFAILRARWIWDSIPVNRNLATQWALYSLLFLALLSLLAVLLPTGYSVGFLSTIAYIVVFIFAVARFLVLLLITPFVLLFSLLMSLFGDGTQPAPPLTPPQFQPPPAPAVTGPNPWLEIIQSILFWGIFLAIAGYSFYYYLRQRQDLVQKLAQLRGIRWLSLRWRWLRERLEGAGRGVRQAVQAGLRRLRPPELPEGPVLPFNFLRVNRLSARERVRFFYLAMVRRGNESGIARAASQTPYEYAATLRAAVPETDSEVSSLTESFVEARYSAHDISTEQAGFVQRIWERVRRALRRRHPA